MSHGARDTPWRCGKLGLMYTTALLDLDGTLTDPIEGIGRSLTHAMAALGLPAPTPEQVRAAIGPPLHDVLRTLNVAEQEVPAAVDAYREYFSERGMLENRLYDGIRDALAELDQAGVTLLVATSKPEPFAREIIEHFDLDRWLTFVAGASLNGTVSTKADVIERALTATGITPGPGVVMVGDRSHDVIGAAAHGLTCVGVEWGYATPGELEAAGAIALVRDPAELVQLLLS